MFSAAEERWAPEDQLKAYDDQVSSSALPAEQVGDINKSDLPGPEALTAPGERSCLTLYTIKVTDWFGPQVRKPVKSK